MESKSLLIGIVSFIAGALLVSTAATTFDKPSSSDSMTAMVETLKSKTGDEFDEEFISQMIAHHEGAVEMAKLADQQAKHTEIKELSKAIIAAQEKEISDMEHWQNMWNYDPSNSSQTSH
jgi:uncharacterized protein (DUF305 family)